MNATTNKSFNFGDAIAQSRAGATNSLRKTQTKIPMKKVMAIGLIGLIGLAAPPILRAQTIESYTFTTNRAVPDGRASGLHDVRNINSTIGMIGSVKVRLKIDGEFNGDLYGYLRHVQNGATNFCVLLNRAGRTATDSAGYADEGFNVTFEDGAPNGDIHLYRDVTIPASPLTGIWRPDGRTADPTNVTELSDRLTSLASFNGASAAGEWTLFLADLESGGTNMLREWGLDITGGAYPSLAWATPNDIVYGTALDGTQLNAAATYNSTSVPGTYTYSPPAGTVLTAGAHTLKVVFTPEDSAAFLAVSNSVTITVTPAALTIAANSQAKVYGEADPALTYTASGFQLSDTAETVLTGGLTRDEGESVGSYAITQGTLAANANYSINFTGSTLTITSAGTIGTLAVSANPAAAGSTVTFTETLNVVAPGSGTPSGTVDFRINGLIAGSGTLSGGVATFETSSLAHGAHTVVAEYAGDGNFTGTTTTLTPALMINSAPVAGADTIERYPTQGVKVKLATLLANDTDADSDTLTATVSTTSANGGTITVANGWVFYTPAEGNMSADSFTYTIVDGYGGTSTGTVTVSIKVDNDPGQNLTIAAVPEQPGSYLITGSGIPGRTYHVQTATTLTPTADWEEVPSGSMSTGSSSVMADVNGVFQFTYTDQSQPPASVRYFRTVYP